MSTMPSYGNPSTSHAIWEPWIPEVGQRVRVLARPECFYCRELGEAEIGLTGVVSKIEHPCKPGDEANGSADPGCYAHRFWVDFDEPGPTACSLSHFAAIELEPVS